MKATILVPLFLAIFTKISATPLYSFDDVCDGAVTIASTWIGEGKNVEVKSVFCPNLDQPRDVQHTLVPQVEQETLAANVCGQNCGTNCFLPAGGGPDPNECHVIADALRFNSENIGNLFNIGVGSSNTITMKYKSCETFFLNQAATVLVYCRTDWAALIDFVAFNCQATQNAHGGNCVANDKRWFVQVNHV